MPYRIERHAIRHRCGHVRTYAFHYDRWLGTIAEQVFDATQDDCPACDEAWMHDAGGEGYWTDSENFVDGMGESHHISDK